MRTDRPTPTPRSRRLLAPAALLLLGACLRPAPAANAPACSPPEAPLLVAFGEMEVAPGAADTLEVFSSTHPGAVDPLPGSCRPVWSLGGDAPATIDARSGLLRIAPDAPDGARFAVSARVGDRVATAEVRVVDPARNPLVGTWSQAGETPCTGADSASPPAEPVRELRFRGDGRFGVTWVPFESYTDYWGTYDFDPANGVLRLRVEHGNFVPDDLDLEGRAELAGPGVLYLSEVWLGSRTPGAERACRLTFHRRGR
ncbi:MAG TPA: hypothetical protein VHG51_09805 [Longimicrobiaceae bacterium]|nr:hypothetical protein [Longimicrobiaceae bacterium]